MIDLPLSARVAQLEEARRAAAEHEQQAADPVRARTYTVARRALTDALADIEEALDRIGF